MYTFMAILVYIYMHILKTTPLACGVWVVGFPAWSIESGQHVSWVWVFRELGQLEGGFAMLWAYCSSSA